MATQLAFAIKGAPVDTLPACPGVYRFLNQDGHALYIGKSVNIRARVRSHLAGASQRERTQRMVCGTAVIDCRPTAGEAGALLLENAAIKAQMPLFNRRQRAVRRLWSITLKPGSDDFLQSSLTAFSLDKPDVREAYGSFNSRHHARETLATLARREQLCPQALGLQAGRGACFAHQLGQCRGACAGKESAPAHNARLAAALQEHRLSTWPIAAPVLLLEDTSGDSPAQPAQEWHLLHNWSYLGTFTNPQAARACNDGESLMFDRDTYRILRAILRLPNTRLFCAETLHTIHWDHTFP
jgi:hypothetical protein